MGDEYPQDEVDDAEPANPQDQPTPVTQPPDEPGEIGWPADADTPGDPSVPEPGSGAAGSSEPPPPVEPTLESPTEQDETPEPVLASDGPAPAHEPVEPKEPGEVGWAADAAEPHAPDVVDAEVVAEPVPEPVIDEVPAGEYAEIVEPAATEETPEQPAG